MTGTLSRGGRIAWRRSFTVKLDDKPGRIGKLASALGDRGINIPSLTGDRVGSQNVINFLASDDEATRRALREAKFAFAEREVLIAKDVIK